MTCLKAIQVNDEIFNQILYDFEFKVRIKPDLWEYYRGYYENKDLIYYNGKDELICCEYIVNKYTNIITNCTVWKQIRVQKVLNMKNPALESTTGSKAKAYITKVLKTVYTDAEIDERLRMFEAEKDPNFIQQHYNYPAPQNVVIKLSNTFKFDINGAHTDALCEIFPKAKDKLIGMYLKRKKNPVFKQYPNLYVGMLAQKSKEMRKAGIPAEYEKTYNWIVQRTSKILLSAMDTVGGSPVYVNTDGFIVQNPSKLITTSKNLGDFKLEFSGDTFVYSDKNYIVYQTGDEKKGSCFTAVREHIDLTKGQVVHYDISTVRNNEGKVLYREPINITKETIHVEET
jgi:hypothetical protein